MKNSPWLSLVIITSLVVGCRSRDHVDFDSADSYLPYVQQIEYPDASLEVGHAADLANSVPPPSVRRPEDTEKWPLTLEQAIHMALANSQVIRSLGGRIVNSPTTSRTIFDPALQEGDPRFGVEAALAAFDAQFTTQLFIEQIDRQANNVFAASSGLFTNDGEFQMAIDKTSATGTQFKLENRTTYNRNHAFDPSVPLVNPMGPSRFNLFGSFYDTLFVAEVRHPLAQGSGVEFNRIAGPNATPGNYNGVLIARIDSDVSLADFEAAVRDLLRDVERTYWELYFAYRDFDAKQVGRRLALESWELEKRRADVGTRTFDQEAFAREQFYLAQIAVENALSGTATGTGGIYAVEQQLRRLLGLPTSDGRLILPVDEPAVVDVQFDWHESLAYAITRRVELRRQQWNIKRRELELVAARNFTKMRVDLVGQYRWRGFGSDLFGNPTVVLDGVPRPDLPGSAFASLYDGDLQDWRLGIEVSTPVGNRQGHAAVRHAELQLAREHAIYDEMERQISRELRASHTELDRAYAVSRSNFNRRTATFIRLQAERLRNEEGRARLDLVLDAQRQAVDAESNYYRALVDYNLALVSMHFSRGTLLDHYSVNLTEGPWSAEAHRSAAKLARRFRPKRLNYGFTDPPPISLGAYPQRTEEMGPIQPLPPVEPVPAGEPMPVVDPLDFPSPADPS